MSWHGTKGFPGGREIKLDPGLKPSTAIYASLNLLSSTSTVRVDDFHLPPLLLLLLPVSSAATIVTNPSLPLFQPCVQAATRLLLSPGTASFRNPSSRSKSWPAATRMITSSYFTLRRPPPLIILFAMLSRSLPSYTCHGERSSRFFHPRQPALFRLFVPRPKSQPLSLLSADSSEMKI